MIIMMITTNILVLGGKVDNNYNDYVDDGNAITAAAAARHIHRYHYGVIGDNNDDIILAEEPGNSQTGTGASLGSLHHRPGTAAAGPSPL